MDVRNTLYTTRGAVSAVARGLGISIAAVSQWKKRGIPPRRVADVARVLRDYLGQPERAA